MAEQQAADTGGRSLIIFIVGGILLVGLFFAGAQFLNMRNDEVAVNNSDQSQEAQPGNQPADEAATPPESAQQNEGDNQPTEEEQQAARAREATERRETEERQAAENREREKRAQAQQEERETAAAAARERQQAEREQQRAAQAEEAQTPPAVARTGPSDDLPSTGPATDYALSALTVTLLGFGIYRWRQSKLALLPKS